VSASRREFLVLAGAATLAACGATVEPPEPTPSAGPSTDPRSAALASAVRYLEARQAGDGSFPSDVYGFWRFGQSTTGFVLLALLAAGRTEPQRLDRGVQALLAMRGPDGAVGFGGPVPDYPTYATALALSVFRQLRPDEAASSEAWLLSQQFRASGGWADHPALGGWGMGSRFVLEPPQAGHVDISMTRRVLEALPGSFDGKDAALAFVRRCKADDSGFFYSPVDLALNKGHTDRSGYGTSTADGLLALLALGLPDDDPEVIAAADFLRSIHGVTENPGVTGGPKAPFAPAMRFSYRAGSSRVFARLGGPDGWKRSVVDALVAEQRPDGSFANESNLQKEDDPLVATAFAVQALVHAG
jgi:hypothetical protein